MPLEEFINSVRSEVAKRFDLKTNAEIDAFFIGLEESAKDNQEALEKRDKMLRDTVAELYKAKRLLQSAVEDFSNIYDHIFDCDGMCDTCPLHGERDHCLKWRCTDEALKLIGEYSDIKFETE